MVSIPLVSLWEKRSLIINFAWMNIKIRFRGTYLGLLWTAVEPLLLFGLLYLLFTSIRIGVKEDFAIYLLTGITLFHAFTRGTQSGLASLKENISIISSLNIRREFFPVVSTATAGLLMFVEVAVLFALMPIFSFVPSWTVVLLPVVLVLFLFLILGMSYLLSIIFVYARDIQPLWGVFVTALFFVTPIFWYTNDATGFALEIQKINPVGQLIEIAHKLVFGQIPPLDDWLYTTSFVFAIFVIGYAIFQRYEERALEQM